MDNEKWDETAPCLIEKIVLDKHYRSWTFFYKELDEQSLAIGIKLRTVKEEDLS